MAGTFGYELDITKISQEEKQEIRQQIKTYKENAALIAGGRYYRLSNPFCDEVTAWEFVSEDGGEVLFQAVLQEKHGNMTPIYIKLAGLQANTIYRDVDTGKEYPSDILMTIGMPLPNGMEEYQAYQMKLIAEDER